MAGSGGFTVSRAHGGDRFYNPPQRRRQQQQHQHHQQQQPEWLQQQQPQPPPPRPLQRPVKWEPNAEADNRPDSHESALSRTPDSLSSASPPPSSDSTTNLDRLMESVTPVVPTQHFSAAPSRGRRMGEAELRPFFTLGDLWDSFKEWSVYGVGVPLLLNGKDSVKQYYVPFLSGIQLYTDSSKLSTRPRWPREEGDAESSREPSSSGSSDCEVDKRVSCIPDGRHNQQDSLSLNFPRIGKLSLREKATTSPSGGGTSSTSSLVFEYLEQDQPHHRKPLTDKVSALASQFPELRIYRSCDLLPSSWFSVAWYPIYRIPTGPTLQNLDASFLTFHYLSTHSKSLGQASLMGRKIHEAKMGLPVFGLASYKLKGSILTPSRAHECKQEGELLQAADSWLRCLQVDLPDYRFFISHSLQWR